MELKCPYLKLPVFKLYWSNLNSHWNTYSSFKWRESSEGRLRFWRVKASHVYQDDVRRFLICQTFQFTMYGLKTLSEHENHKEPGGTWSQSTSLDYFLCLICRQSLQCTVYWKQSYLVIWPSRYCQVILHINAHDLKDIWFVTHHAMFIYHLFPFFLICREVLSLVKL